MVELVAWVAGVDHKESSMVLTLDDGDGVHVLPVTVRLSLCKVTLPAGIAPTSVDSFPTRAERARRRQETRASRPTLPTKGYERSDVRVGDTVRVVGRIDEWARKGEWVRQLVVDGNAGGWMEAQFDHAREVERLRRVSYGRPFDGQAQAQNPAHSTLSSGPSAPRSPARAQAQYPRAGSSSAIDLSSQAPSELTVDDVELRSSQLTDRTFRQYMLDHMTQEVVRGLQGLDEEGVRAALGACFPEYSRVQGVQRTRRQPEASHAALYPFTMASLLRDPRLSTLAMLVVDNEMRKEDRRRRRRIRDGTATRKDLERKVDASHLDRGRKVERLVRWVIRAVAEEGSLVQVRLPHPVDGEVHGYLPLPPQLLFPLCAAHVEAEWHLRANTIRRRGDPKTGHGMTIDELVLELRRWGEEGRWERVGDWKVEEAMEWAESNGRARREGRGWWLAGSRA
ncbi:hypothetical protein IAU60_001931 [Kwoniella sp. DSM 27419]